MGVAKSFRDLRVYQLARVIDRADDFCKYSSDTDYRGIVKEEPSKTDDSFFGKLDEPTH